MPSPLQQQVRLRKLIYLGLIVILFCAALLFRRNASYGLESQANDLGLREQSLGEVELAGSLIRRTLTGSRGLAVCWLWSTAIEKQKKHQWNELELYVRSVTKLQPHFITPWLFQSWNLAYNVSVESDRVKDKYFYITRGVELLGEGERQNRNQPDLRFNLGFYLQQKIGSSDEKTTMRSLFQMSCMSPDARDPKLLRPKETSGRSTVDLARYEEFCQRHPFFVRRLRDWLKCETPDDIIDFLAANQNLPGCYEDEPILAPGLSKVVYRLKPEEQRFPVLPPSNDRVDPPRDEQELGDDFDNFTAARAWFTYAQRPLPPPEPKPVAIVKNPDATKYRMPRAMASHIFRGYPARGQTYVAEHLETEGWFDQEGWHITSWFTDDKFEHGGRTGDAVVGTGRDWAVRAWSRAHDMWVSQGKANGLYKTPEELKDLADRADLFRKTFGNQPIPFDYDLPPQYQGDQAMRDSLDAHQQLHWYDANRSMTNYPHFFYNSQVEMDPKCVRARKLFFQAEQLRRAGRRDQALEKYGEALPMWRDIMLAQPEFRKDSIIQEDSYEIEVKYLDLIRELRGRQVVQLMIVHDLLAQAAVRPPGATLWLPPVNIARGAPLPVRGPLDVTDPDGLPLILNDARERVRQRAALPTPAVAAAATSSSVTPVPEPVPKQ